MGPLKGFKVIELAGIGPAPMAGMMLADMGAEVIRIERGIHRDPMYGRDVSARGKKSIILNLKSDEGREALLKLVESSDALIEGYRPGVAEKLGIGPKDCMARNPKLIFGRMTGWGQTGPLAQTAGHDINYIALTGALHACGVNGQKPVVPLNLVGDFGGGGMLLAMGVLAALLEVTKSGQGQVVDAAMVDGAAQMMWMFHTFHAAGNWNAQERGVNMLDGGAFFYDTYETADNKFIALGSIEPQFFTELIQLAELDTAKFKLETQFDPSVWPELKAELTKVFMSKTRDQWCDILSGTDACFAPVLTMLEAPEYEHNKERSTYINLEGVVQPAPAPRYSRTVSKVQFAEKPPGEDTNEVMLSCGYKQSELDVLREKGALI